MIGIFAAAGSIKGLVRNGLFLSLDPSTGISGTTWTDDSNSGNSGTLNNSPSYSKYSGGYMWFNGSNNFVSFTPFTMGNIFTLDMWIKIYDTNNRIWVGGPLSNATYYNDFFGTWFNRSASGIRTNDGTISTTGTWRNYVITRNGDSYNLYLDGILFASGSGWTTGTWNLHRIGASGDSLTYPAKGNLGAVRLYNRVLNPGELSSNYSYTRQRLTDYLLMLDVDVSKIASYSGSGSTAWNDLSRYSQPGTITDATYTNDNGVACLSFNGTSSTVSFGNVNEMGTEDMTILSWVKLDPSFNSDGFFAGRSAAGGGAGRYAAVIRSTKKLNLFLGNGGSPADISTTTASNTTLSTDKWIMCAITFDRTGNATFYVNGIYDGFISISSYNGTFMTNSTPFRIGSNSTTGGGTDLFFKGKISSVKMYSSVLTQAEVKSYYNDNASYFGHLTDTLLWYDFGNTNSYSTALVPYSATEANLILVPTLYDLSGRNEKAEITSRLAANYSSEGGGSINFDGINDYFFVPMINKSTMGTTFTISIWFKAMGTVTSPLFTFAAANSTSPWLSARYNSSTTAIDFYINGAWTNLTIPSVANETYHHLALTYNGSQWKAYLDGISRGGVTASIGTNSGTNFYLGNQYTGYFRGFISYLKIYNSELDLSQINSSEYTPFVSRFSTSYTPLISLDANNTSSYPGSGTTWSDLSGNGYNATINNTTYGTESVGSNTVKFISFNGTNSYGVFKPVPYIPRLTFLATVTVSVWIKFSRTASDESIIDNFNNGGYGLLKAAGGVVRTYIGNGTAPTYYSIAAEPSAVINTTTWYHYAGIHDGSYVRIYRNGTLITSTAYTGQIQYTRSAIFPLILGGNPSNNAEPLTLDQYFSGKMSIVKMWDRPLSTTEVTSDFNLNKTLFGY
jgi:hypothetical protein